METIQERKLEIISQDIKKDCIRFLSTFARKMETGLLLQCSWEKEISYIFFSFFEKQNFDFFIMIIIITYKIV